MSSKKNKPALPGRWPAKWHGDTLGPTEYFPEDFTPSENLGLDTADDDFRDAIKTVIATKLTEAERRIFLLYAEKDSRYTKVARALGVNSNNFRNYIIRIRLKIIDALNELGYDIQSTAE